MAERREWDDIWEEPDDKGFRPMHRGEGREPLTPDEKRWKKLYHEKELRDIAYLKKQREHRDPPFDMRRLRPDERHLVIAGQQYRQRIHELEDPIAIDNLFLEDDYISKNKGLVDGYKRERSGPSKLFFRSSKSKNQTLSLPPGLEVLGFVDVESRRECVYMIMSYCGRRMIGTLDERERIEPGILAVMIMDHYLSRSHTRKDHFFSMENIYKLANLAVACSRVSLLYFGVDDHGVSSIFYKDEEYQVGDSELHDEIEEFIQYEMSDLYDLREIHILNFFDNIISNMVTVRIFGLDEARQIMGLTSKIKVWLSDYCAIYKFSRFRPSLMSAVICRRLLEEKRVPNAGRLIEVFTGYNHHDVEEILVELKKFEIMRIKEFRLGK